MEVTLTWSEAVNVDTTGGTPSIGLTLGGTEEQSAPYLRGHGTTDLVFGYTLTDTDGSHNSMLVPGDSLALNGGTIQSVSSGGDAALGHTGAARTETPPPPPLTKAVPAQVIPVPDGPTAQFSDLPDTHNGVKAFKVTLTFSEEPELSYKTVRDSLLEVSCATVSCATVTGAQRVTPGSDLEWKVTVKPSQAGDITLTLPVRECNETGAVCIASKTLARPATATIPGETVTVTPPVTPPVTPVTVTPPVTPVTPVTPPVTPPAVPLTASLSGVPSDHNGSKSFEVRLTFSEEPDISYKTVRDTMFTVTGGNITGARRVKPPHDLEYDIVVRPSGNNPVSLSLAPRLPACNESGAVCTAGGQAIEGTVSATVQGPAALSVADATVQEGPGATLAFAVTLDRARDAAVTVDYATSDGTAEATDYTATSGELNFAPGDTEKTISVPVLDDVHDEGSETLTLRLSNPMGARIADAEATGTISNSDPLPKGWLSRFGRTSATQVVGLLDARFDEAVAPASQLTLGGHTLDGPAALHADPSADPDLAADSRGHLAGAAGLGTVDPGQLVGGPPSIPVRQQF